MKRVYQFLYPARFLAGSEEFVVGFLDDESARLAAAQLSCAGIPVKVVDDKPIEIPIDQVVDMVHNHGMPFASHDNIAMIQINEIFSFSENSLELAWLHGEGFIATTTWIGDSMRDIFLKAIGAQRVDWIVADKRVIREALNAKVYVIDGVDDRGKLPDGELHLGAFLVGEPNYI